MNYQQVRVNLLLNQTTVGRELTRILKVNLAFSYSEILIKEKKISSSNVIVFFIKF